MYRQVAPTAAPEGTYIMAHFWKCTKYRYSRYFVSSGCPSPSGRPAIEGSGSFAPRSHKIGTYRHFGPPAFGPCLSASPIKRLPRGPLNSVSTILSVQKTIPQNWTTPQPMKGPAILLRLCGAALLLLGEARVQRVKKCFDRIGKPIIRENYVGEFYKKNGLLYRKHQKTKTGRSFNQLVVPKELRRQVMSVNHESAFSGHLGAKKTEVRILPNFFWTGLCQDVIRFCLSCDVC